MSGAAAPSIRYGTPAARWVLFATVLGAGISFLDGTVVNVALPAINKDLGGGLSGLQWTLDAYLVTLSSLLLLGGSLGDIYGRRRVFVAGLVGFALTSAVCGAAPTSGTLIAARAAQGIAAALLVPGSLAIISSSFHPDDRGRAVGAWSGLAGVSTAIGPFVGGWLIDAVSWRLVFLINLPLAAVAVWVTLRHVPETLDEDAVHRPDFLGAFTASVGLGCVAYALIESAGKVRTGPIVVGVLGVAALVAFIVVESRTSHPMLPLSVFRNRQFSGANATTLAVYGGLGGTTFLVVLQLQVGLGYSAIEAGAALLPVTFLMLLLSPRAAALGQRIGPRLPMTVGPFVVATGLVLFGRLKPGETYFSAVLPAATVFGLGLALTVAPLTAAVLAAVDEHHVGVGSGVNNAVARVAGLLAVAVLPTLAGIDTSSPGALGHGFGTAMHIAAGLCAAGGAIAWLTVRTAAPVSPVAHPNIIHACQDEAIRQPAVA